MEKKYEVAEAIWIAAAVFAYQQYIAKDKLMLSDVYLKAPELQEIAQEFTDKDVRLARIHQHNNGDHAKCSHRSLRRMEGTNRNPLFRVTATGEFNGDREYPTSINMSDEVVYEGITYNIKSIKEFLDKEYVDFIKMHTYHQKGKFDSWEVLSETVALKKCDLSFFKYKGSGVPIQIRWFFDADDLVSGDKKDIILLFEGKEYSAYVSKSNSTTEITRIFWNTDLETCFKAYDDADNYPTCKFVKRATGKYEVIFEKVNKSDMLINAFKASKKDAQCDKNIILYGPPGTGKTYNSAIHAVKICEPDFDTSDYDKVMEKYNQLKAEHRIAFTTFHQSYGYEEFIEGIRPMLDGDSNKLEYRIESGVFKRFCEMARTPANIIVNPNASIWFMRLESDNAKTIKDECLKQNLIIVDIKDDDDWTKERFVDMMQIGDYVISYAGNSIYIDAIGVIEGEAVRDIEKDNYQWSRKVNWTKLEDKVDVKSINGDKYLPNFSIAKMNHMKASDLLRLLPGNIVDEEKPYVFIIDEINRGNISKIFGELITLIETTKREGGAEPANAILPYSGQAFSVPSNVYILGTMNTADRSIQLMDTALRRRFSFIEMMPDADVLRKMGIGELNIDGTTLDVAAMLEAINDRIAFLFDREHTIGHAFFTGLKDRPTIEKLASIFEKSVIPLLQEYFYEDYQKIQLVLGDNAKTDADTKFILDKKVELKNLFMGSVEDVVDEKEVKYEINSPAFRNIQSYKGIANGL